MINFKCPYCRKKYSYQDSGDFNLNRPERDICEGCGVVMHIRVKYGVMRCDCCCISEECDCITGANAEVFCKEGCDPSNLMETLSKDFKKCKICHLPTRVSD